MSETSNSVVYLTESQAISVGINPAAYKGDVAMPNIHAGTVEVGDSDSDVSVTVTGAYPDYYLNFVLPPADDGEDGITPNFTIGNVTSGETASATITGTKENPVLSLVLPIPNVPYITEEAEGSIVTIEDAAAAPALSAVAMIEPVQAGEGEPSPDNIRPITGHEGCEMRVAGKNLLNANDPYAFLSKAVLSVDGDNLMVTVAKADQYAFARYVVLNNPAPGDVYTLSCAEMASSSESNMCRALLTVHENNAQIAGAGLTEAGNISVTIPEYTGSAELRVILYTASGNIAEEGSYCTYNKVQLELGSTATEYEPYQGSTYEASFGQIVYGGSYDFVSGKLTVDRAMVTFDGTEEWKNNTLPDGTKRWRLIVDGLKPAATTMEIAPNLSSSHYPASTADRTWLKNQGVAVDVSSSQILLIYDSVHNTDTDEWKAYLAAQYVAGTPVQVCYELATSLAYDLTPQQVDMLFGLNNVWSDTGESRVVYISDTKTYVDNAVMDLAEKVDDNSAAIAELAALIANIQSQLSGTT